MQTGSISDYERERGKPRPDVHHSVTQTNLIALLHSLASQHTVFSELTLRLNDRKLVPDLSVYDTMEVDLLHDELYVEEPPLLAILIPIRENVLEMRSAVRWGPSTAVSGNGFPKPIHASVSTTNQQIQELEEAVEFLLEAGVQSCWLVQPPLRTVTVFPGHMEGTTVSDGTVTDPVLEIDVDVRAMFDPDV